MVLLAVVTKDATEIQLLTIVQGKETNWATTLSQTKASGVKMHLTMGHNSQAYHLHRTGEGSPGPGAG